MATAPKKKPAAKKPAKAPGRPVEYDQATANRICELLADGKSLRAIGRMRGMPKESTIRGWARDDREGFAAQYARARELGYEHLAEEIIEIADTPRIGTKTVEKESGIEITTVDMIEHRRLQVDARKWMLAKMLPKVYGDKVTQELTGKDGGPIEHRVAQLTDEQLEAEIAKLAAQHHDGDQ